MTDVKLKTGGHVMMANSGRDDKESEHFNTEIPISAAKSDEVDTIRNHLLKDHTSHSDTSQSTKRKAQALVMVHDDIYGKTGFIDESTSDNHTSTGDGNIYKTRGCREMKRNAVCDDSFSLDSLSADSQSVLSDHEIDNLFRGIGDSDMYLMNMSLSSTSEEDFDNDILHDDDDDDINSFNDSDWNIYENSSDQDDDWTVSIVNIPDADAEGVNLRTLRPRGEIEELPPWYPHRAMMYHECEVCLSHTLLRRRVCCDFHICAECLTTYISGKVNEANVKIECPNYNCHVLIHRDEVNDRLPKEMKDKFAKFLVNANADPFKKTCPACSEVYSIEPKMLSMKKKKLKHGLKIQCPQCNLYWCFQCQAPFHEDITCKQHQKGDKMVKKWAKELSAGQSNAQKCPKCKILIQKVNGCDHMKCSKCNTDFCYRCGDRYISIKLLGNHWSKFSLFGCKYRLMPKRPALRRLIRGASFAARLLAGVALAGLGIAAGAILVGASVVIVPGYGIFRLQRHLQMKKKRKRAESKNRIEMHFPRVYMIEYQGQGQPNEETETENPDARQVQVTVHRSVSFTHEDVESVQIPQDEGYEFYINKYTSEGTDMVVTGKSNSDSDQVIVLTDVTEVPNIGGYPTVVAHIVSKMAPDKEVPGKSKSSSKNRKDNCSQSSMMTNPLESFLGKGDQTNICNGADAPHEASSAECCLRKKASLTADAPCCSWENLSDNQRVDSGYGEDETDQEIPNSESKLGSTVSGDDADSTKRGNNGCFGNIFSRRVPVSLTNTESPVIFKNQALSSQKKLFYHKAGTWEKCSRDHMQSLLKSSPFDPVNDFNKLTLIMQKSPVSSVDISDMFSDDIRSFKNNRKQDDNIPEPFNPDGEILDKISLCAPTVSSEKIDDQYFCRDNHPCDRILKNSNNVPSMSFCSNDGIHIPLFSEDTHL